MKKYFYISNIFLLAIFLLPARAKALTTYFPVIPDTKTAIGLKISADFNLDRDQVELKVSTKSKTTKLEAISLIVDQYSPIYLAPASSTSFWLDLSSGDHLLTVAVASAAGYVEQATSSVFVPHLQAPFIDLYPLTVYKNQSFVLGGQSIYPAKQVVIHFVSQTGERTFVVDTDLAGRFNWRGKLLDQGEIEIWAEVLDGSLRSRPSNPLKLKAEKIFSAQWFSDRSQSVEAYFLLRLTLAILIMIALLILLGQLFRRNRAEAGKSVQENFLQSVSRLREEVIGRVDLAAEAKGLPTEVALPALIDLQRTLEIVSQYVQKQIKTLSKKKKTPTKVKAVKARRSVEK